MSVCPLKLHEKLSTHFCSRKNFLTNQIFFLFFSDNKSWKMNNFWWQFWSLSDEFFAEVLFFPSCFHFFSFPRRLCASQKDELQCKYFCNLIFMLIEGFQENATESIENSFIKLNSWTKKKIKYKWKLSKKKRFNSTSKASEVLSNPI
jgi:hypothetical protein